MNCLVTKLKSSVQNESLLKLGEIRATYTNGTLVITANPSSTIKILKSGVETTTESYSVNDGVAGTVSVVEKYNIKGINCDNTVFDLAQLSYCTSLTSLRGKFKGNLADLNHVDNLATINCIGGNMGDFNINAVLPQLTSIVAICNNINLSDISPSKLPSIQKITFNAGIVKGNWSDISGLSTLTSLTLSNCDRTDSVVSGSFASLASLVELQEVVGVANGNCSMTYESDTLLPSDRKIVCFRNMKMTAANCDNYLINMANCQVGDQTTKSISVLGYRTSASDAAVATLQEKGYTVRVVH